MSSTGRERGQPAIPDGTVARGALIVLLVLSGGLSAAACGRGSPRTAARPSSSRPASSTTATPPAPTTTSAVPASVPTCLASQLDVQYRGSQGGAGNWISAFWVANPSGTPCALRSSVTVELLDDQGNNRTATLAIGSPILLSAMGSMPPPGQDPAPGQLLADVALEWPTEANAVLGLGGTGTRCPLPLFQPQSARVTFAGAQPVVVGQLSNAGPAPSGSVGSICGSDVRIFDVSSLTAPELP